MTKTPAPKCSAKSKQSRARCKNYAIPGGKVCRIHGGAAPQVKRKAAERLEATKERVLLEMCRIAYVDPRTLFDANGKLLAISKLDDVGARALAGITFDDDGGIRSIRLIDKKGALDSLMRHLGMFEDRLKVEATLSTVANRLINARKRIAAGA